MAITTHGRVPPSGGINAAERLDAARDIGRRLADSLVEHPAALESILSIGDPNERSKALDIVVERMLASMPTKNPHNRAIGPFYDTAGLERWTGKTRQAIEKWRRTRKVLAVTTDARRILYPSFQFGPHGELLPGLPDVLAVLGPQLPNPLTQARWLNTPTELFEHRTAAELLRSSELDTVLTAARADAKRLAA